MTPPVVTYVIVTHNRRDALLATLEKLRPHLLDPSGAFAEAWVVDNASTDDTAEAVAELHPHVHYQRRDENEGVWARNYPVTQGLAKGRYIVFLDDDSYPLLDPRRPDPIRRCVAYLDAHPPAAAVFGRCLLPEARPTADPQPEGEEACAFPGVLLSGACCIRADALREVGGFRREFFRKAGEYDLSFRLWNAGHRVERFHDIVFRHDKVSAGRSSAQACYMDLRNNLLLAQRYLPRRHTRTGEPVRRLYRAAWLRRYAALARRHDTLDDRPTADILRDAIRDARHLAHQDRIAQRAGTRPDETLNPQAFEALFQWDHHEARIRAWAQQHDLLPQTTPTSDAGVESAALGGRHPGYPPTFADGTSTTGSPTSGASTTGASISGDSISGAIASRAGVVIADGSKNLVATLRACRRLGLPIRAIVTSPPPAQANPPAQVNPPAHPAQTGSPAVQPTDAPPRPTTPCITEAQLHDLNPPPRGVINSNLNPAQAPAITQRLAFWYHGPILQLVDLHRMPDLPATPAAPVSDTRRKVA